SSAHRGTAARARRAQPLRPHGRGEAYRESTRSFSRDVARLRNCACTRRSPFWLSTVFDGIMSVMRLLRTAVVVTVTLAGGLATGHALAGTARAALPRPDHVVVVVEENHPFGKVIGPAPYITSLANGGGKCTASFPVTH